MSLNLTPTECPRGCDAVMVYVGVDDGFGEYGDMACGIYECSACGEQVTGECFETSPHEETNEGYDEDD